MSQCLYDRGDKYCTSCGGLVDLMRESFIARATIRPSFDIPPKPEGETP